MNTGKVASCDDLIFHERIICYLNAKHVLLKPAAQSKNQPGVFWIKAETFLSLVGKVRYSLIVFSAISGGIISKEVKSLVSRDNPQNSYSSSDELFPDIQ